MYKILKSIYIYICTPFYCQRCQQNKRRIFTPFIFPYIWKLTFKRILKGIIWHSLWCTLACSIKLHRYHNFISGCSLSISINSLSSQSSPFQSLNEYQSVTALSLQHILLFNRGISIPFACASLYRNHVHEYHKCDV